MWYVMVHRFISLGRRYDFSERELFFLHYKFPSSHPDQRDHFEEGTTAYRPNGWTRATGVGRPVLRPGVEAQRREPRVEAHHGAQRMATSNKCVTGSGIATLAVMR